jgi:L-2,4-diaminobutyrate transaminase
MIAKEALLELDRRHFFHPGTHAQQHAAGMSPSRMFTSGNGIRLQDADGRTYIDAFAGLYCVNVGYGREEIVEAIERQSRQLCYYHTYLGHTNPAIAELSARLVRDWAPAGMATVFYGMSGSDANETQVKLAWYYNNVMGRPARKKIIARRRGYHGSGIVTGSLTGLAAFHACFDLPIDRVLHTMCPDHYRDATEGTSEADFVATCVGDLERLIDREGPETIAAFIAEPMQGSGGIVPPPAGYWAAIQQVLQRHDILLIADEVVCGFGRLGAPSGSHRFGIAPDLMSVAKGMTSAYVPLSGAIVSEKVWDVIKRGSDAHGTMGHGWTYSGHPLGAAAALANLDIIEREHLVHRSASTGAYLLAKLKDALAAHPIVGNVRGVGLLAAIELVADRQPRRYFDGALKVSHQVVAAAMDRGLIVRALGYGDIVGLAPPLVTTHADVDDIVATLREAVDAVAARLPETALSGAQP